MAEGFGTFLAIAGLAVLLVLLARCSTPRGDATDAWHRHEARDMRRHRFDRWMASAIYDPDWQSHWEACDRQLESVRVAAMEAGGAAPDEKSPMGTFDWRSTGVKMETSV